MSKFYMNINNFWWLIYLCFQLIYSKVEEEFIYYQFMWNNSKVNGQVFLHFNMMIEGMIKDSKNVCVNKMMSFLKY